MQIYCLLNSDYIVEMCEEYLSLWQKFPTLSNTTQHTVKGLINSNTYRFRVRAENEIGISEPVELKNAITAKDPYGGFIVQTLVFSETLNFYKITE